MCKTIDDSTPNENADFESILYDHLNLNAYTAEESLYRMMLYSEGTNPSYESKQNLVIFALDHGILESKKPIEELIDEFNPVKELLRTQKI